VVVVIVVMKTRLVVIWKLWRETHILGDLNRIGWAGLVVVDLTVKVVLLRISGYL
jgi:hypothetical protein